MPDPTTTAATDCYVPVPDHVCDRHGNVWRVVRDGGMVTRADYGGIETCGINYAESAFGPLRPVYVNGGPNGLAVEPWEARDGT